MSSTTHIPQKKQKIKYKKGNQNETLEKTHCAVIVTFTCNNSSPPLALTAIYADGDEVEAASGTSIDLYLIAGQSNASGTSKIVDTDAAYALSPELENGFSHVLYAGKPTISSSYDLTWVPTKLGMGKDTSHLGPEAGMAVALSKYYNSTTNKIAGILKYAHGGSKLSGNDDGNNWVSPSYAEANGWEYGSNGTGAHYAEFLEVFEEKVAKLVEMGYTDINIKGIYWMQGEGDRNDYNTDETAKYYATALKYLISDLRADLSTIMTKVYGTDDGGASDMPFHIGSISESYLLNLSTRQNINKTFIEVQRAVAHEVANCYFIDNSQYKISEYDANINDAIPLGSDTGHWSQADMLEIGQTVGFNMYNYGVIPETNTDAFVLFKEGALIGSATTWKDINTRAREALAADPGNTVSIVLRKDLESNTNTADKDSICYMNGTVVFDLSGHTLTLDAVLLKGGVDANYNGDYASTFIVQNGTLIMDNRYVLLAQNAQTGGADKTINIVMENLTIGKTPECTQNQTFFAGNTSDSATKNLHINLTLNNCILDYTKNTKDSSNIFHFNKNKVTADIIVKGGNITTPSSKYNINLYSLSSDSTLTFGKDASGDYTTVSVPRRSKRSYQ